MLRSGRLKIKNYNHHKVMISFRINYYWQAIRTASSQRMQYCVKARRKIRGKMWDLVFSTGKFKKEQILDDRFLWDISDLEISHHADCKSRLNIRIKPVIHELEPRTNYNK